MDWPQFCRRPRTNCSGNCMRVGVFRRNWGQVIRADISHGWSMCGPAFADKKFQFSLLPSPLAVSQRIDVDRAARHLINNFSGESKFKATQCLERGRNFTWTSCITHFFHVAKLNLAIKHRFLPNLGTILAFYYFSRFYCKFQNQQLHQDENWDRSECYKKDYSEKIQDCDKCIAKRRMWLRFAKSSCYSLTGESCSLFLGGSNVLVWTFDETPGGQRRSLGRPWRVPNVTWRKNTRNTLLILKKAINRSSK